MLVKMKLTVAEKVKILVKRKGMTIADLADKLGTSRQNLSNKLGRSNFSENEIYAIAEAMDCDVDIAFINRDAHIENL